VTFPEGLTSIGDYAFYQCNSLYSVTFPDALQTIGRSAFFECSSLVSASVFVSTAFTDNSSFPAWCMVIIRRLPNVQINEDDVCTICLDPLSSNDQGYLVRLDCGHMFHSECIRNWQSQNATRTYVNGESFPRCPNCNAPSQNLGNDNIYRLIQLRF